VTGLDLPWSKKEIVRAMVVEYRPADVDDPATWPFYSQVRALQRLALSGGGPPGFAVDLGGRWLSGRAISELEDAVFARLGRVWQALRDGRDPNAGYETPLRSEMH
jgi:hypothetical protein